MTTRRSIKTIIALFWVAVGFYVAINGVREFDTATKTIPMFRGMFWLLIGSLVIRSAVDRLKEK